MADKEGDTVSDAEIDHFGARFARLDRREFGIIRGVTDGAGNAETTKSVEFAIAEFNTVHPDIKVTFERQQWTGIVEKLTTSLSSGDSPDVIELGNTQAQAFEAAGALTDLTDKQAELGDRGKMSLIPVISAGSLTRSVGC